MNQDLSQLKDIHLPAPSPWWDWAIGWWVLLLLAVVLLVWSIPKGLRYMQKQRQKKMLKQEMQQQWQAICEAYAQHKDSQALVSALNILLKQVALTLFPKHQAASLTGKAWLQFLDSQWQNKPAAAFASPKIQALLLDGMYRSHVDAEEEDIQALCDLVQGWLKDVAKHV